MNLKKKKKGFTLIELMAVIAIIAILAAVLVPTVSGYIERSKKTAVITQIRNVVSAVETYNATTYGDKTIADNETVASLLDSADDVLRKQDLLGPNDADRLGSSLTVGVAKKINADPDAISKITLNNGVYASTTIE